MDECVPRSYCVLTDHLESMRKILVQMLCDTPAARRLQTGTRAASARRSFIPSFSRLADTGQIAAAVREYWEREFQCTYIVNRVPNPDICPPTEQQQDCM